MVMWTAIVIIVGLFLLFDLYETKQKIAAKANTTNKEMQELLRRLDDLEYRLANLESLMLEQEKENRFYQALHSKKEAH